MSDHNLSFAPEQQAMLDLWEKHLDAEFRNKSVDETLSTMDERPYVNHVPVLTGGVGQRQLRRFYQHYFIPRMPPDTELVPISRTVGQERIVDEFIFKFTHSVAMDWLLPGVPPTGRRVEVATVVIVAFKDGKIAHEHIHWDQATVLVQLGLLDPAGLPVAGVETARKLLDPSIPSNELMKRSLTDDEL
jgi:carboxymethylenebutenolidase